MVLARVYYLMVWKAAKELHHAERLHDSPDAVKSKLVTCKRKKLSMSNKR